MDSCRSCRHHCQCPKYPIKSAPTTSKEWSSKIIVQVWASQVRPVQSTGQVSPVHARPGHSRPGQSRQGQPRPVQSSPRHVRPFQARPVQARPVLARAAQCKPGQASPVQGFRGARAFQARFGTLQAESTVRQAGLRALQVGRELSRVSLGCSKLCRGLPSRTQVTPIWA